MASNELCIGMDVGSTTVKAVVIDPATTQVLWNDYQRHHTKQPEKVLELLEAILGAFPDHRRRARGACSSPARARARSCEPTGGKFVQEVNAVTLAVESCTPTCAA